MMASSHGNYETSGSSRDSRYEVGQHFKAIRRHLKINTWLLVTCIVLVMYLLVFEKL